MKKGLHDEMNDDLRPEYDLSDLLSHGARGKYAKRFRAESIVIPKADEYTENRPAGVPQGISPGSPVRIKADPRRRGVITGKTRDRARRRYWQVMFPEEGPDFVLESQLELISEGLDDPIELLKQGKFGRAQDLREILTYTRLNGRLANLIYSMETTNTDFYAYQFKPVVNFLESPGNGIVIADEVGLGKTIEAGLIWTELRARMDARRLLVLCPAMLQEKWREELLNRFGIDAEISDAAATQQRFSEFHRGSRLDYALIGSIQGLRPRRKWDTDPSIAGAASDLARYLREREYEEPLLDLLIVDEAHYLRNPETSTADIGRLLRNVATHVVLLSATPIHLRSRDLYQLLNLVDEDTFNQPGVFDFILEANEPLVAAREIVLGGRESAAEVIDVLANARSHPLLASNRQLASLLDSPPTDRDLNKKEFRSELANKLEKINLLGRVVTRTRKREVEEWRVLREAVAEEIELTPVEREFYENVTGLVRDYCEQREAHEGFLLVTPQRQMASSMPAALREWKTRASIDAHAVYEDLGDDSSGLEHLGPLVRELTGRVHELGDYDELKKGDSKYARFSRMLKHYLAEFPREKVVLFAYFRATLYYLNERLTDEGIRSVTLTGGTGLDKHEIIRQFRDDTGSSILLSSEVASEGVDLQFARVVVNYDLPWNPMKVEQRIGRIDRLGQQAPKITIWNLFYSDTIDSRIYNRLYLRLGLFERTLGGLEAILGEEIRGLTMELLRGTLSPEQEEERIEQAAMALANYRLQEEELEQEAGNLIAHGDYILNQVRAIRELNRWITGEDLWIYVRDFFAREYAGSEFKQITADDLVFDIKLSGDARFDLDQFLRSEKLLHQTALSAGHPKGVRCEFRNRPRSQARAAMEYITQFHPLIRFVNRRLRGRDAYHYHPTVSVAVARAALSTLPCGIYGFTVHKWSVRGLRNVERLNFQVKPLNGTGTFLNDDDAEQIVTTAARSGNDWLEARTEVDHSDAASVVLECIDQAESRFRDYVQESRFENEDRADVRKRSFERHWNRQRKQHEETLTNHRAQGRVRLIPAVEGKLAKLNEKMEQRLREIESQRILKSHPQEICMGLIRVE